MVAIVQFTVTDLAARVSAMPGHDGYTIRNAAYDLRKLHGDRRRIDIVPGGQVVDARGRPRLGVGPGRSRRRGPG
jgi:hypothetical protein